MSRESRSHACGSGVLGRIRIILGGMGNLCGSLAAAAIMILVLEALRFAGLPGGIAANARQVLYGAALLLVGIWQARSKAAGAVGGPPDDGAGGLGGELPPA